MNANGCDECHLREVNNNLSKQTGNTVTEDASVAKLLVRKASLQEIIQAAEDSRLRSSYIRKGRSLSDGLITKTSSEPLNSEAFPSLPNEVLEKLGLHGDRPRERLSEDDLEQKFTSLALAFSIDSATVKDRCERQRRNRDQTEMNLSMEIEKLIEQIDQLQSMCTDIRQAELLSTVSAQISTIMQAVQLVSIAAERYGSVQHEERLTESVGLMVDHVQTLKQQRDSARRQLQYTKKVLQNSSDSAVSAPMSAQRTILLANGKKIITKRRASVATFTQTLNEFGTTVDLKKFTTRVSDLSLRASSLNKGIRPNRLELIGDLDKIKEGLVQTPLYNEPDEDNLEEEEEESKCKTKTRVTENNNVVSSQDNRNTVVDNSKLSLREKIRHKTSEVTCKLRTKYHTWCIDGTIHEICCLCALLCFSMSLLTVMAILLGYEYAK